MQNISNNRFKMVNGALQGVIDNELSISEAQLTLFHKHQSLLDTFEKTSDHNSEDADDDDKKNDFVARTKMKLREPTKIG